MFVSQATYAAAAAALADVGEWEWCLVLLEELEQHGEDQDDDIDVTTTTRAKAGPRLRPRQTSPAAATAATTIEKEEEETETVLEVELDETGTPVTTTTAASPDAGVEAKISADTLAAYTATVRACGEGKAGAKAVVGVLDRMRWAGVAPGEGTYAAAVAAFQACGGVREGEGGVEEGEAAGGMPVEVAARALIDYEKDRDGTGWASPFLYRCVSAWCILSCVLVCVNVCVCECVPYAGGSCAVKMRCVCMPIRRFRFFTARVRRPDQSQPRACGLDSPLCCVRFASCAVLR